MSESRDRKFVKCSVCGKTSSQTNHFYMCDKCGKIVCMGCKKGTKCADHSPMGSWLHSTTGCNPMVFK